MEGILVATAAPQDIHFNSFCAFQGFGTATHFQQRPTADSDITEIALIHPGDILFL